VRSTETQRIRTGTKFARPSAGHSERAFCSSVTKTAQLIFLETSHIALTIDEETLCLSIPAVQTLGSPVKHGLTSCLPPYLPPCQFFEFWERKVGQGSTKKNLNLNLDTFRTIGNVPWDNCICTSGTKLVPVHVQVQGF
jgi:hypothetical protein